MILLDKSSILIIYGSQQPEETMHTSPINCSCCCCCLLAFVQKSL